MESQPTFDFRDNIRIHASIVGVLFTIASLGTLLCSLLYYLHEDQLPESVKIDDMELGLLLVGIFNSFFTTLYWIGFLKRVRWCLAVIIALLTVNVAMHLLSMLIAFLLLNYLGVFAWLVGSVLAGYELQVTRQLHTIYFESTGSTIPHQKLNA